MPRQTRFRLFLFSLALIFLACISLRSEQDLHRVWAIKDARIVTLTGPPIEKGTLVIRDGLIEAVGAGIPIPKDAEVIDGAKLTVYPGLMDGLGQSLLKLPEEKMDMSRISSGEFTDKDRGITPGLTAFDYINLSNAVFEKYHKKEDVTSKLVEKIRDYLKEARRYLELKKLAAGDPGVKAPEYNAKYEALGPVLDGTLPVIVSVEKAKDIELAIKFVQDEKLKAIFRGCAQGFKVADKIKQSGIPVIIDSLYTGPSEPEDGYDAPYRNVVELAKAGVLISFSSGDSPAQGKDLPYHAAKAVAFGLPAEEALRALTINPAKILGVADRLGSIEAGKDADLLIATGDPLDMKTEVKQLVINGRAIDMSNWWETLYDKFKKRPEK